MSIFLQICLNALIAGSINAILASGFSIIYSTNRFVYLAHGAVVTLAAYILFTCLSFWHLPFVPSALVSIAATALLGWLLFYLVIYPLRRRKTSAPILLIASAGLLFLVMNVLMLVYGAEVKSIDVVAVGTGWDVGGAYITPVQFIIVVVAVVILVALSALMRWTRFGMHIRSVADNPELAAVTGINTFQMQGKSFLLGSVLAALAGILVAVEENMTPYMGVRLGIAAYTSAVIGGVTSVPGAILGGYVLGAIENFGIWYLPSGWKEGISYSVLLGFLLVRPNGILGTNKGVRDNQ